MDRKPDDLSRRLRVVVQRLTPPDPQHELADRMERLPRSLMRSMRRSVCSTMLSLTLCVVLGATSQADGPSFEEVEFFETHIRPVLVEKCYECHSDEAKIVQGGLRLDTAAHLLAGGDSGPAIEPHRPDESLLVSALRYESFEMPPNEQLPQQVIDDFAKWVSLGAPDPRTENAAPGELNPTDATQHWSFARPRSAPPPKVSNETWARGDIDRFILARLESAGLTPSVCAAPRVLLRRLYFDLTGLPPSAEELDAFERDPSDAQYEAAVDRLLAHPSFGERWGRYWLDLARYADTKGYVFQEERNYKNAFKYRDWVIGSFNDDMPFGKFIVAQLASDQTEDPSDNAASGFLTLGRRFLNNPHDIANDRIDVISRGLLGLTVACSRCHDHKYDPIPITDYYSLYGVLASSEETTSDDAPPVLVDREKPIEPVVFLRGNPTSLGPPVERHFLTCLSPDGEAAAFQRGSGRLELAEAIASRDNPLTARVWVNRVWSHLFGRGLVRTTSDFGVRGERPTHPQLLDTLACEFVDNGWSTKRLVRQIVLSSTYRQASDERTDCAAIDPENQLLWRANRRRLDLESMRDSLLVAAGRLDTTRGGPSVELTTAPFAMRRSVYGFIERQNLPAFFRTFDFANPNTHTPERSYTVSPQQALFLMNSPFVIEQAMHLSDRSRAPGDLDELTARRERIARMFKYALGRGPTDEELADACEFIGDRPPQESTLVEPKPVWQFGWGTCDETSGRVEFNPLPHFNGSAWQGGDAMPDATLGWAMLSAAGGHPGDAAHAVIRRWTAPAPGTLHFEGILSHEADQGDGVRGRVIVGRLGIVGAWEARHGRASTTGSTIEVQAGDTVDFVTDCRGDHGYDSFRWTVTVRLEGVSELPHPIWNSTTDFQATMAPPIGRWEQLAQALLMSNEFAFVD